MKKNKSILCLAVLCCLLLVCALTATACGKKAKTGTNIVGDSDAYDWNYVPAYSDACDSDTVIDGKLDETRWKDRVWLQHNEDNVQTKYTTSFSEKGLYIAMQAKDPKMQWNSERAFMKNSSFYLYVISNKATEYHAFQCYAFYIDERNSRSRQTARWSAKGLRSEDEGGVPTLTAEFFASWDALNYTVDETTEMPEKVRLIPQYRFVESIGSAENAFLHPAFASATTNYADINSSFSFDENGYMNADAEGAELGDTASGYAKSDGWDFSKIKGDESGENKQVESILNGKQAIFFKNIHSSRYSYSVKMKVNGLIPEDTTSGMWGVCDIRSTKEFHVFRFDSDDYINSNGKSFRYYRQDYNNTYNTQLGYYNDPRQETDFLTLRVIKDGSRYYYIFNEQYENCIELEWLDGKSMPGLFARDMSVTFSDWEAKDYEGADKDAEFAALCDQYMHTVNISSSISGGSVTADKMAMPCDSDQQVNLTVTPQRGFVLTDITVNGTSVFVDYTEKVQNGVYTFTPENSVVIDAVFTELPADKVLRITGKVKRSNGTTVVGLPYSVSCENDPDSLLYIVGTTTSAGMIDFTVLRAGNYTIDGRAVEVDGKYTLAFNGVFGDGETPTVAIDTNDEKFDGAYYAWEDITLDPCKLHNMTLNEEKKIQTTHLTYDPSDMFAYFVNGTPVVGSFKIEMSVDAHNDKWPCYGITVEDENDNSVQFLAAGPYAYRRMHGYDGINYDQKTTVYHYQEGENYGKFTVLLTYDAKKDVFAFYINDVLIDTVERTKYLTGNQFFYGPCGYMSGADGFNTPVTAENPFALFTQSVVTQSYNVIVPNGATLCDSDGNTISDGKVPVFSAVTVSVPVSAEQLYTIYVGNTPLETIIENGYATVTFDVTEDCTVTCVAAYEISGKVTDLGGTDLSAVTVAAASENGNVVYATKPNANGEFTLVLPSGTFYVSAYGGDYVSKAHTITVADGSITDTLEVTLNAQKAIAEQLDGEHPLVFDVKSGNYVSNYAHGEYAGGYLVGAQSSNATDPFMISTKLKNIGDDWPSGGFMIGTGPSTFVKFELVEDPTWGYLFRIKDRASGSEQIWWFCEIEEYKKYLPLEEFTMALAYNNGTYYVFLNGDLILTLPETTLLKGVTIKSAVGEGERKLGLYGEQVITFADWSYSFDTSAIGALIGKTLTAQSEGITLTVNGQPFAVGEKNVLLGDTVTVSINAAEGKKYSISVDGIAIETTTANGKATATFTVTKDHTVAYSIMYAVSGTVTDGDADTEIAVYTLSGTEMYKGKGATFSVELGDGTYIVTAQGKTKVGKTEFTVGNAATSVTVALDQEKIEQATIVAGSGTAGYDATTGTYKFGNGAEWLAYFAAPTVNAETPFLLTATVDWFKADGQYAGFAVQTVKKNETDKEFLKFGIYLYPNDGWYGWANYSGDKWSSKLAISDNTPITLALVYNGGNYYLFVNDAHVLTVEVSESYPAPNNKVGLCASHEKTFADWGYSTDISGYDLTAV